MKKISKHLENNNSKIASFLIAISPIIAPYAIGKLSLFTVVGLMYILLVIFFVNKPGIIKIYKKEISYLSLTNFVLILGLLNIIFLNNNTNLINSIISLSLNSIVLYFLWQNSNFNEVIFFAKIIGYICGIFAIYQIIVLLSGSNVPNGKIPFLNLVSGQGWVEETWGFRINSLFSEPSYFAIYLIPLFAYSIKTLELKNSIIFSFLIIISSSSLGILLTIVVIIMNLIDTKNSIKDKGKTILLVLVFLFLGYIIIENNSSLKTMVFRTMDKIVNINNNDIRLNGGYIKYLVEYGPREIIIGVGLGQFQNYFMEKGIYLYNYSNSLVMIIMQFGIVGTIFAICYYFYILKISIRKKSFIFFIILMLIMLSDFIIFNIRYFYLLYFILYYEDTHNKILWKEKSE